MKSKRALASATTALLAAVLLFVSAPLHASHHHDDAGAAAAMHAPCALCLVHAPAGTPPDATAVVVEPDSFSRFFQIHTDVLLPVVHGRMDACRAPPLLLAR